MVAYYLWTAFCDEVSFSSNGVSNHKVDFFPNLWLGTTLWCTGGSWER